MYILMRDTLYGLGHVVLHKLSHFSTVTIIIIIVMLLTFVHI